MHVLRSCFRLQAGPAAVWDFLRRPPHLAALTPPEMGLEMPADAPPEKREGCGFVDEQRVGPLGRPVNRLFVRRNLERTFAWRAERMRALLEPAAGSIAQSAAPAKGS